MHLVFKSFLDKAFLRILIENNNIKIYLKSFKDASESEANAVLHRNSLIRSLLYIGFNVTLKKNDYGSVEGDSVPFFPVFLSVVFVVRNQSEHLEEILTDAALRIGQIVNDYEFIVVDNASEDKSISLLKSLTEEKGLPNLQIYALTKEVDVDTASWVGLENSLGDFIAVADPMIEDVSFLPTMLDKAVGGADIVFALNSERPKQSVIYNCFYTVFNGLYKNLYGIHFGKESSRYRILTRAVVNFILQHSQPAITYRHLYAMGGFARVNLTYTSRPKLVQNKSLGESIDRGMRLLVSTTRVPMRLVTSLSLFGAIANLVYAGYVVAIAFFKEDVTPGWTSLSLQQSGMFFLISLVLLVLGEYVLHMVSLSNEGPLYHIGQEYTSARLTRGKKLNIEEERT